MNQQNAHEYLPLVQAIADGKTVQVLGKGGNWYDSPLLNTPTTRYRIKPEPRTFEMWLTSYGSMYPASKRNDEYLATCERITVLEVVK